jgi:hypothetical protein
MLVMDSNVIYVLKVLLASGILAVVIRYLAPLLSIAPDVEIALSMVLLPSAILAIALGLRTQKTLAKRDD